MFLLLLRFFLWFPNFFVFYPSFFLKLKIFLSFLSPPHCIIMTQYIFQSFLNLVYHAKISISLWILFFFRVISKSQFTIGFFQIILCWRLIQKNNMIMQIFTLQILRVLNNLLKNNSLCSCVKTFQLGVRTSRIFISVWVIGGDSGFASDLSFFLVNTISNAWYSLYISNHTYWTRSKGYYLPQ